MDQFKPPLTAIQLKARQREDCVLDARYPGCYVAYLDTWNGDSLSRTVVVVAAEPTEFHRKIAELTADIRNQLQLTLTPDADEAISAPSITLA